MPNAVGPARVRRIVLVTGGLMGVGATVGAVCGAAAVTVVAALHGGGLTPIAGILGVGAVFGAMVGVIGAPVISWVLLRRVPLGRAIAGTAFGTVAGAVLGELSMPFGAGAILGGLLGFGISGFCLYAGSVRPAQVSDASVAAPPASGALDA